jgi:hypothetical protein
MHEVATCQAHEARPGIGIPDISSGRSFWQQRFWGWGRFWVQSVPLFIIHAIYIKESSLIPLEEDIILSRVGSCKIFSKKRIITHRLYLFLIGLESLVD